jgi:hypothetical protein
MRSAIDRPRRGVGSEEARVIAVASLGTVFFILFGPLAGIIAQQFFSQAAVYVAEHAPQRRRGASTAWIQTTGILGSCYRWRPCSSSASPPEKRLSSDGAGASRSWSR